MSQLTQKPCLFDRQLAGFQGDIYSAVMSTGLDLTPVQDISTEGGVSGWRSHNVVRQQEITDDLLEGRFGQNIFRDPQLVKQSDQKTNLLDTKDCVETSHAILQLISFFHLLVSLIGFFIWYDFVFDWFDLILTRFDLFDWFCFIRLHGGRFDLEWPELIDWFQDGFVRKIHGSTITTEVLVDQFSSELMVSWIASINMEQRMQDWWEFNRFQNFKSWVETLAIFSTHFQIFCQSARDWSSSVTACSSSPFWRLSRKLGSRTGCLKILGW